MTMRVPCQYAIIQFMPYPETGEFANVGVVLACPQFRYLSARLAPVKRTKRVTDFFEALDAKVYRDALKYIEGDLHRFADEVLHGRVPAAMAFSEVVRAREALIRFGNTRSIMAAGHPKDLLDSLFERFVERDFATKEYHEVVMRERLDGLLTSAKLRDFFVESVVGDEVYPVRFPFVSNPEVGPQVVIKPLNLTQAEPVKIYEHGGAWINRIFRLRKHGHLPETVLFAVDPADDGAGRINAAREVEADLIELGAIVRPIRDTEEILQIASRVIG